MHADLISTMKYVTVPVHIWCQCSYLNQYLYTNYEMDKN